MDLLAIWFKEIIKDNTKKKRETSDKNVINTIILMLYTYTFCTIIYKTIERTAEIIYLFRNGKRSMEYSNDLHIHRVKAIKSDRRGDAEQALRWQVLIYRIKITRHRHGSMVIDSLWIPRGYERFVTVDHGTFDRSCMRPVTRDR